jgi:hypothetical protein
LVSSPLFDHYKYQEPQKLDPSRLVPPPISHKQKPKTFYLYHNSNKAVFIMHANPSAALFVVDFSISLFSQFVAVSGRSGGSVRGGLVSGGDVCDGLSNENHKKMDDDTRNFNIGVGALQNWASKHADTHLRRAAPINAPRLETQQRQTVQRRMLLIGRQSGANGYLLGTLLMLGIISRKKYLEFGVS